MEGKDKVCSLLRFGFCPSDVLLQAFYLDNDLIFLRVPLHLDDDLRRVDHIDNKHAEEESDEEGEGQVFRQPAQAVQDIWMDQEVVQCAEKSPEEGELRADQTTDPVTRKVTADNIRENFVLFDPAETETAAALTTLAQSIVNGAEA